jgi:hypothetical protein
MAVSYSNLTHLAEARQDWLKKLLAVVRQTSSGEKEVEETVGATS